MSTRISQSELSGLLRKERQLKGKSGMQELLSQTRASPLGRPPDKSIFLSHSHRDKTIVEKVAVLFSSIDVNIYLDWTDNSLPSSPDVNTAQSIKSKIQHCNKFLLLATVRALQSKWCNWELGIADSIKGEKDIAIMPILSKTRHWEGNEYLTLYPEIVFGTNDLETATTNNTNVVFADQQKISLAAWFER